MESLKRILEKRRVLEDSKESLEETLRSKPSINCERCRDSFFILLENGRYGYCECAREIRMKKLWDSYGVNISDIKKIGEYKPYDPQTLELKIKAIKYIEEFRLGCGSFGILGQSGSGKSHISIGIGGALISKGFKVVYMPYIEALRELKGSVLDFEGYERLKNRYALADVLVIDDLFKDKFLSGRVVSPLSEVDMRHMYPILNYRYNNSLPTVFSSECSVADLLLLDEGLGGRIVECCGENLVYFKGKGYNYRVRGR